MTIDGGRGLLIGKLRCSAFQRCIGQVVQISYAELVQVPGTVALKMDGQTVGEDKDED